MAELSRALRISERMNIAATSLSLPFTVHPGMQMFDPLSPLYKGKIMQSLCPLLHQATRSVPLAEEVVLRGLAQEGAPMAAVSTKLHEHFEQYLWKNNTAVNRFSALLRQPLTAQLPFDYVASPFIRPALAKQGAPNTHHHQLISSPCLSHMQNSRSIHSALTALVEEYSAVGSAAALFTAFEGASAFEDTNEVKSNLMSIADEYDPSSST